MTNPSSTTPAEGSRGPSARAAEELLDAITDLEDLVSGLEGCVAASSVIAATLMHDSIMCRGTARALWWTATRGEGLVERLQVWHGEAVDLARAAVRRDTRP